MAGKNHTATAEALEKPSEEKKKEIGPSDIESGLVSQQSCSNHFYSLMKHTYAPWQQNLTRFPMSQWDRVQVIVLLVFSKSEIFLCQDETCPTNTYRRV